MWTWKLTWFLRWTKLKWSQCGGWNLTWFQCRDENDLVVVWVVWNDLIFDAGRKSLFSKWAWELIVFCVVGRSLLDFSVMVESDLISVWGWNWFSGCVGYLNWPGLEGGANFTCFYCKHANWLAFCMVGQNWHVVSVWGTERDFKQWGWKIFGCRVGSRKWVDSKELNRNWIGFCVTVEKVLFSVQIKIDWIWCRRFEIDLILEWG